MATYAMLRDAIEAGNSQLALRYARQVGTAIFLGDAARLLALAANDELTDPEWYERAAVRWIGRLAAEAKGVTLSDVTAATAALDSLDADPAALDLLIGICRTHGCR